jgi:chromosomal replication initiation ATPase DnaA
MEIFHVAARVQPRQLAFALPHAESLTRDNFLEGPANEAALALVDSWPEWPNRIMLLVGPEGSGKSHLAAIWADKPASLDLGACADRCCRARRADDGGAGGRGPQIVGRR